MLRFIASFLGTLIILGLALVGLDSLVAKAMAWKAAFDVRATNIRPVA